LLPARVVIERVGDPFGAQHDVMALHVHKGAVASLA
jgi:hypothetical protein